MNAHLKRALNSATVWVGSLITALPDIVIYVREQWAEVAAYIPQAWQSGSLRVLGIAVLIARARSLFRRP